MTEKIFCGSIQNINNYAVNSKNRRLIMAISSYITELKQKHANLSQQLERSQRIPSIDSLDLKTLKLKKLKIKEEIIRLSN